MSETSLLRSETAALAQALARIRSGSSTASSIATAVCGATSAYRPEYKAMVERDAQRLRQATALVESALNVLKGDES